MRAVRFQSFGDPANVLAVEDVPMPEPGPGQVLVRMRIRPVNPSDLFMVQGVYGIKPTLPATPGLEGMGVIAKMGADVLQWQAGQRVVPLGATGTWQEYVLADAQTLIAVPDAVADHDAAMLLANPTSAWLLLHDELKVPQGEWLLQNAANSAVGRFVIQLAKRAGTKTINVVRRRDVMGELQALGADEVICEADDDVVARVKEITGGKGVRYAIDSVAGRSGGQLIQALAPGGTAIIFGAISNKPLVVDSGALLFKGNTVRGWWLARWFRTASPEQISLLFAELMPLVANGTLHAPVAAEYDLADVKQAVAAAAGSERNGKIVLVG